MLRIFLVFVLLHELVDSDSSSQYKDDQLATSHRFLPAASSSSPTPRLRSGNLAYNVSSNYERNTSTRSLKSKSSDGTLPQIFIVGVQKGGSSSLFELLIEHPHLCGGLHKESHCFDKMENFNKGLDFYESQYTDHKCLKDPAASKYVDGTPMLHYTTVWQRIYERYSVVPDTRDSLKFIALLREPVARDYSWYEHAIRYNLHEGVRFSDVKTIQELYRGIASDHRKGRYLEQLVAFTKVFRRDQILVLSSAAVFQNTPAMVEKIRQFIGVTKDSSLLKSFPHDQHLHRLEKEGLAECVVSHVPGFDCAVRDRMGAYYEPLNKQLFEWLEATKGQAHPSEPPFWPMFDSYKSIPCVENSRAAYDLVLAADLKASRIACVDRGDINPTHLYQPI